jgi:hypothetical protein
LAKKVFVKPTRSLIGRLRASAHHEVNSKLLDVLRTRRLARSRSLEVLAAGGVRVVLRQGAVADDEELDVLEEAGPGPEAVALVALDLVERLPDVDPAPLELDVHHRQAVDQDCHVIAVRAAPPAVTRRAGSRTG